jgi:hypothetical protein
MSSMNVYQWAGVFVVAAVFLLVIILPPTLVAQEPDTGWPQAYQQYSVAGGVVISAGSLCAPSTDFGNIRALSNAYFPPDPLWTNPKLLSNLAWAFGQLVMADIFVPVTNASAPVDILLHTFPGTNMSMNLLQQTSGGGANGCYTTLNGASPLLDMDWLYNMTDPALRAGSVRGRLALSTGGYLPLNAQGAFSGNLLNENIYVAALANLFALEHNRWAETLALAHPGWNNDQLFWKARSYIIAIYQAIVWQEWVPAMFGYWGNLTEVRPGTPEPTQEFALIASQFYRTLVAYTSYAPGNATAALLRQQTLTATLFQGWSWPAAAFDSIIDVTLTRNAQTNIDYMSMYMVWERQMGLGSIESIQRDYHMTGVPPRANSSATVVVTSPSLPEFFAEPLFGPNTTTAVPPSMSWIIMEQLQRSARYDPLFYAGFNMTSYLGYGYVNTLRGTRLHNVIYANVNIGPPLSGGLTSAFYQRAGG